MTHREETLASVSTTAPARRSRTIGLFASLGGLLVALFGLTGLFTDRLTPYHALLIIGGLLAAILGLRIVRSSRKS